jgi:Holliday junction resolvase
LDPIARRNKANKRRGADWEIELMTGLRSVGEDVERLRLTGAEDEGDLAVREDDGLFTIIEAKNAKLEPGPFLDEAERERLNYAKHRGLDPDRVESIVVVKRRGKGWRKAFVLTTVEAYFGLAAE